MPLFMVGVGKYMRTRSAQKTPKSPKTKML